MFVFLSHAVIDVTVIHILECYIVNFKCAKSNKTDNAIDRNK